MDDVELYQEGMSDYDCSTLLSKYRKDGQSQKGTALYASLPADIKIGKYTSRSYLWYLYDMLKPCENEIEGKQLMQEIFNMPAIEGNSMFAINAIGLAKKKLKSENKLRFMSDEMQLQLMGYVDFESISKEEYEKGTWSKYEVMQYDYVKLLLNTGNLDQCIERCTVAINSSSEIYKNKPHFFSKRGEAYEIKKEYQLALENYIEHNKYKDEWYVYSCMAEIYEKLQDQRAALFCTFLALCKRKDQKDFQMLVKVFKKLSILFEQNGFREAAHDAATMNYSTRQANGWKISSDDVKYINQNKLEIIENAEELQNFYKKTKVSWVQIIKSGYLSEKVGVVDRLNPDKKSGFIKVANKNYYFKYDDFMGNKNKLQVGDKVLVSIRPGFDGKRKIDNEVIEIAFPF